MAYLNKLATLVPLAMIVAACSNDAKAPSDSAAASTVSSSSTTAHAAVNDSAGQQVAMATLTQDSAGTVHIEIRARGLSAGEHGVHFHTVGTCTAPTFASAGGHFNPDTTKHHGLDNPAGPHAGDLPNMLVDSAGNANYTATTNRVSLTVGPNSLFDSDGSALVIHATADDNMSDPAGNAGGRIGCGLIEKGAAPAA
ncbi:MAG: superoxide dismutase family protein [Gemmatimonadaceae bacterium]